MDVRMRRGGLLALALSVALLAAACGGGDDSGTDTAAGATPSSGGVLGPLNKATGTPITFGYLSTGKTTTIDSTPDIRAAQAAAKYVNEHKGGINGHPIELKVCEVTLEPAKAADCANQMVAAKVPAVLAGSTLNGVDPIVKTLSDAKIPFIVDVTPVQSALTTPGVFIMANPLVTFVGPAAYAKKKSYKRVVFVLLGVPALTGPAQSIAKPAFDKAGVTLDVLPVAPGTADMTPQIQSVERNNPDLYLIVGDPNFCGSAFKALRTLGSDAELTMIPNCVSPAVAAVIPGGFEGIKAFTPVVLEGPEYDLFKAVLADFGPDAADARNAGGYQSILGFEAAMEASKVTDLTPTTIADGMRTMPPLPYPLTGGSTFQCDGKQTPLAANICAKGAALATADKAGVLSSYEAIEG
ncbi:MAG: putative amino acid transporter [Frankiales bacterium]|nr:putative amino acid transporter [Frankiales bacterium]